MLDLFFKKYAWTANLLLLFAGAWLCARTVNIVVGAAIRPRPSVDLSAVPAAPPRAAAPTTIDLDNLYKLVGAEKPAPPPVDEKQVAAKPKPQNCKDRNLAPARSGLRAQLVAGVVADPPEFSIASITDLTSRETKVYGVGEEVLGAKIISIERLRDEKDATGSGFKVVAILCNGGQKEFIDFESGEPSSAFVTPPPGAPAAPAAPAQPVAEGGGNVPPGSVTKVSDNRYEVKRSFIEGTLSNLNNVATQARIVPSFKNGVANGFKLFSIQPGSLYQAIGVENGDVIQRINGYEINSPDKALEVYTKLRESSHITIEVERNGQTIRKEYNVTGS